LKEIEMKLKATRGFFLLGVLALMMAVALPANVQGAGHLPTCPTPITTNTILTEDCTVTVASRIFITEDNVTLDCDGHTINGDSGGPRDTLFTGGRDNVTVQNCTITGANKAILLGNTTNSFFLDNTVKDSTDGFFFNPVGSTGNIFLGNNVRSNSIGFRILGPATTGNTFIMNNVKKNMRGFLVDDAIGNTFEDNSASKNGVFGFHDNTGATAALVQNIYINNSCKKNTAGGSSPTGLCSPQP
jgi:parallel beta-helix repeat protein